MAGDIYRPIVAGEPLTAEHPIVSAERNNRLSDLARKNKPVGLPSPPPAAKKSTVWTLRVENATPESPNVFEAALVNWTGTEWQAFREVRLGLLPATPGAMAVAAEGLIVVAARIGAAGGFQLWATNEGSSAMRYGVVSSATAAGWSNGANTLTYGEIEAWEFARGDTSATINRAGENVTLRHWWTDAPLEGSLVGWLGEDVMLMTCGPFAGWS